MGMVDKLLEEYAKIIDRQREEIDELKKQNEELRQKLATSELPDWAN